jgi:hypothetical protein
MAPAPAHCAVKQKLLSEFTRAASECNRMQSAQIKSLVKGDGFMFELEMSNARDRRDEAKYAILAHQAEHGC